jgi:hypothetical protein
MNTMRDPSAATDVENLIAAIKREALTRGDIKPFHERTEQVLRMEREPVHRETTSVAIPARVQSLREWMPFHGTAFVTSAYRTLLNREPDPVGLANFSAKIAQGGLSRWEVLGRLRASGEGRVRKVRVKGLWLGFALATIYRVPIIGPLLSVVTTLLRVPPHFRDQSRDDRLIAQLLASRH